MTNSSLHHGSITTKEKIKFKKVVQDPKQVIDLVSIFVVDIDIKGKKEKHLRNKRCRLVTQQDVEIE